jgi:hypothetical protein
MKSPIANGNVKPAASGPSPSKAFGDGAGAESQNGPQGKATLPPDSKATPTLGNFDGKDVPVKNDHPNGLYK